MSTLTLEAIKTEQTKLAAMIAKFEVQAKIEAAYPITVEFPTLKEGELHVGVIISADGKKREHIILLPGEFEGNWQQCMDWAKGLGGDLPDRIEQAMLYQYLKAQFKEAWYWSNTKHASGSDCAWNQGFGSGGQHNSYTSSRYRARAVRRLAIQ